MSLAKQLFRETSLERLSSPEQLDQILQITSPKGWLSLIALWVLLACIVAWSVLGSVSTKESGRGILVSGGGLKQVVSPGAGRLRSIVVRVGDRVEEGAVVAEVDKQDLADQIKDAESQLSELRTQMTTLEEYDRREESLQTGLAEVERKRLDRVLEFSDQKVQRLRSRRDTVDRLVSEGNMTEIEREKIDEEIETALVAIEQARLEIEQLSAKCQNASFQRERQQMSRRLQADELDRRIVTLRGRLQRESMVASPFAGRVVEVRAALQAAVGVGDPILLIEPAEAHAGALEAILYVSAATGKRVQVGMGVEISPSTVKREEHGSLVGDVTLIADVPTSRSAMLAVLSDEDMVEQFTRDIGLPLEVRVALRSDPLAPSGYRWTSSGGPPTRISAGTLCSGWITIERQSPISLVIPMVKKATGAD